MMAPCHALLFQRTREVGKHLYVLSWLVSVRSQQAEVRRGAWSLWGWAGYSDAEGASAFSAAIPRHRSHGSGESGSIVVLAPGN